MLFHSGSILMISYGSNGSLDTNNVGWPTLLLAKRGEQNRGHAGDTHRVLSNMFATHTSEFQLMARRVEELEAALEVDQPALIAKIQAAIEARFTDVHVCRPALKAR